MTPTQVLMDEHQLILAVLDSLEEGADRLDSGDKVDPEFFLDAAEFVADFADGCHHSKEENILFVAMTAMNMPQDSGPVAVMLSEHDEGRRYTDGFRSAAEQMKDGNAAAAADVVRNVFDYVNLLREHINKENNVLFPMAEQIIGPDLMKKVSEDFQRVIDDDAKKEIPARYRALAEKLSEYLAQATSAA
jgi:hemerythrin-like domain-containing protein